MSSDISAFGEDRRMARAGGRWALGVAGGYVGRRIAEDVIGWLIWRGTSHAGRLR